MKKTIEKGKTLLVDGPASVSVVSGKVDVFGATVKNSVKIVVREGKRLPFTALETANLGILLGENAGVEEVDGSTIPQSWAEAAETLKNVQKKPFTIMILGKSDSGKTSFCTYLINRLISENQKIAVLDGDLGQSDVGPPCTVAYAFATKSVTDLFTLRAENAFFVGFTSPSESPDKAIKGMTLMKQEILDKVADFVVVNSDGWVEGEEAVRYKSQLAEALNPDLFFCIPQSNELEPLLAALERFRKITVDSPVVIRQRSREKRRNLRELGYAKYLAGAKVKTWPLRMLTIETQNDTPAEQKHPEGSLLGLYDAQRKLLGIGVLHRVDPVRKALKVLTSVSIKPAIVAFGKVRLDENFKENVNA
ncbi:MAG: Clp1/GlmU family protein [Candidatus Bathyarchaeota archaeon]|nr:Clp1/GlmU family protein [Candidatus Bathyarchaeota archaeon]